MATLAQLRTRLLGKLDDGSIQRPTAVQVDDQINATIAYYNNSSFWFNQATATVTATAGSPNVSLASIADFKEFLQPNALVLLNGNNRFPLKQISPLAYDTINYQGTGRPDRFTYRFGGVELYYYPDQNYNILVSYKKSYAALVNDGDTNDFTNYLERAVEYRTLADLLRDYRSDFERGVVYDGVAMDAVQKLQRETDNRLASGMLSTEDVVNGGASWYNYPI
jgi:hypothetical protein